MHTHTQAHTHTHTHTHTHSLLLAGVVAEHDGELVAGEHVGDDLVPDHHVGNCRLHLENYEISNE